MRLSSELSLGPSASLREMAAVAPAPWDNIFEEHRKAFLADTQEIFMMAQVNRDLLSTGHKAAREALTWLSMAVTAQAEPQAEAYSAAGTAATTSQSAKARRRSDLTGAKCFKA